MTDAETLESAPLLDFRAVTTLEHEHRRLMDEHHSRVDFSTSTASSLPEDLRRELADLWRGRTRSEHRSVSIFATYTLDLLAAGAPASALSVACRAQLDEVRHAELFASLTRCYSDRDETPPAGISPIPDDASLSLVELAAVEALHLCVGAETFSCALLHALYGRARDPAVRSCVGVVLSDEIHHARMGWSYLRATLDDASLRATVQRELVPVFDGLHRGLFGTTRDEVDPLDAYGDVARDHGYMPTREQRALFAALVRDVWTPALPTLGLDPSALDGRYELGATAVT
ncbi:MAG: ferritin-like domain-containing protein [Myxococcales bacterium]|nr:ferritin-like domain-containing protein [Myxococcales bacterium]